MLDKASDQVSGTIRGPTPEFGARMAVVIHKLGGLNAAGAAAETAAETIRNWRDGRREPKGFALVRLASAANVSVEWLLTGRRGTLEIGDEGGLTEETHQSENMVDRIELMRRVRARVDEFIAENGAIESNTQAILMSTIYELVSRGEDINSHQFDNILYLAAANSG